MGARNIERASTAGVTSMINRDRAKLIRTTRVPIGRMVDSGTATRLARARPRLPQPGNHIQECTGNHTFSYTQHAQPAHAAAVALLNSSPQHTTTDANPGIPNTGIPGHFSES
jgi:hypothetical protein